MRPRPSVFPAVVSFSALLLVVAPSSAKGQADSEVADLLRVTSTELLPLTGTWLHSTEDDPGFSSQAWDDGGWLEIATPGQWNIVGIDSDVVWYRRHFLVAETLLDEPLALEIPIIADAHEMYVNGVRVGARGRIAADGTLERKSNQPGVYRIPPGVIQFGPAVVNVIAMRVADDVGWGGVVRSEFYIGGERVITRDFELQLMRRAGLALAFLVTGLLYFVFYFGSRQPAYLYYALYSSLGGVVVAALASTGYWFIDSFPFNHLLQHGSYHLIPFAFTGFLHTFFDLKSRVAHWVRVLTIPLLVVFALGFFSLTFLKIYAFYTMPVVLGLIVLTTAYGAYVIVSSAVRLEVGAQIMLAGLVVLGIAVTNDVLNYFKVLDTFRVVPEGLLVFTGALGFGVAYRFAEIYQRSDRLRAIFSRFVPHEFISQLPVDDVLEIRLGSQIQETGTVLFCDVRSFTRMSEHFTPGQTFNFINSYLAAVAPVIREHSGVVDKYIGDGIMALFPAGAESEAIRCAVELHEAVDEFNRPGNFPPIRIGVGLHMGDLMLGIIGEEQRLETTVISNTVNVASHLETLTKVHGSPVIISGRLKEHVPKELEAFCHPLGVTQAKGQRGEVAIHEIRLPGVHRVAESPPDTALFSPS